MSGTGAGKPAGLWPGVLPLMAGSLLVLLTSIVSFGLFAGLGAGMGMLVACGFGIMLERYR